MRHKNNWNNYIIGKEYARFIRFDHCRANHTQKKSLILDLDDDLIIQTNRFRIFVFTPWFHIFYISQSNSHKIYLEMEYRMKPQSWGYQREDITVSVFVKVSADND